MVIKNRQERQLMRQRGASSRNVPNVDFGFALGLGSQREERQQMRQRGAGTRKADPIDFGFSFRTPSRSQRSNSKTPISRSSRSMTVTRSSNRRSRECSQPLMLSAPEKNDQDSKSPQSAECSGTRSSKRRKINTDEHKESQTPNFIHRHVAANSSRRTSRRPMFTIADPSGSDGMQNNYDNSVSVPVNSPLFVPQDGFDKENTAPPDSTRKYREKEQSTLGSPNTEQRSFSLVVTPGSTLAGFASPQPSRTASTDQLLPIQVEAAIISTEHNSDLENQSMQTENSTQPAKKRKKRKSVVLGRKKRRSSGQSVNEEKIRNPIDVQEIETVMERQISPSPLAQRMSRKDRSTDQTTSFLLEPQPAEVDDEADEDYVYEELSPEPPTPAPCKKNSKRRGGNKATSDMSSSYARSSNPRQRSKKSSFPILVHRMAHFETLPTIAEEDEVCDDDENRETANFFTGDRTLPNAVDVLAQICRESIATIGERLSSEAESRTRKAELKRKRCALDAFATDLDSRLFDMSAAVENRITLESRVRKQKREQAELQARWIEVRKQREQVALKCDRIRREHWQDEHDADERWQISEAAHRLEAELERNQMGDTESLEYLLQSVARNVSNVRSGGGLLDRIKCFNSQLESLAGVLEMGDV